MASYLIRSHAYSCKFLVRLTQQMCNIRCVLSIKWVFYWTDADKNIILLMQNLYGVCCVVSKMLYVDWQMPLPSYEFCFVRYMQATHEDGMFKIKDQDNIPPSSAEICCSITNWGDKNQLLSVPSRWLCMSSVMVLFQKETAAFYTVNVSLSSKCMQ
jgi:hypothetical protein